MKKLIFAFAAALMLAACGRSNEGSEARITAEAPTTAKLKMTEDVNADAAENAPEEIDRKLIKNGNLRFETEDLDQTYKRISAIAKKYRGYLSRDDVYKSYNSLEYNLQLRIPAKDFDAVLQEIGDGVAYFDQKSINVQDVTEQYFDVEIRLKTKKELELRYLELLKKANTVKDIIEIEKEIGNLRSDIEVMEGRLRLMQNQIGYATIDVNFYVMKLEATQGFGFKFKQSISRGWQNMLGFIIGMLHIWPFVLIGLVVLIVLRRRMRKKK